MTDAPTLFAWSIVAAIAALPLYVIGVVLIRAVQWWMIRRRMRRIARRLDGLGLPTLAARVREIEEIAEGHD